MKPANKTRLNLYINKELVEFAKKWSHVTNVSISKMLEEYLNNQREIVASTTPFQWISNKNGATHRSNEGQELRDLEEYLDSPDEKEFCHQNPEHPRAKVRQKLTKEYEKLSGENREQQKQREKELIQRWLETFSVTGSE